jgi:hypothetical protein
MHSFGRTKSNLEHMLLPIILILSFAKALNQPLFLNICFNVREALPRNMYYQKHKDS